VGGTEEGLPTARSDEGTSTGGNCFRDRTHVRKVQMRNLQIQNDKSHYLAINLTNTLTIKAGFGIL
jgi:hypothetical protein